MKERKKKVMEYQTGIAGKIYNYILGKKQVESRENIKKEWHPHFSFQILYNSNPYW